MTIQEITGYLEEIAPLSYQESYDNAGLIVGNAAMKVNSALLCLDVTEQVLDEAIALGSKLIISHHPVIFKGLKKLTGKTETERILIKALENKIALYSAHTNLDNMPHGVNGKLAEKLGLRKTRILEPMSGDLKKLAVYVPESAAERVRTALFMAGAGKIGNYDSCSFNASGIGTFRGNALSNPAVGLREVLHHEPEQRIETIFPKHIQHSLIQAMLAAHPYEEVAYDIYPIENLNTERGAGLLGQIEPMEELDFLKKIKDRLGAGCLKHSRLTGKKIQTVAICGGSGSFLIQSALAAKADIFITGDIKYHDFFDVTDKLLLVDAGHFETEQFTIELFYELLKKKFPTFACNLSKTGNNPVFYL